MSRDSAQLSGTARNVAEINKTQTAEDIQLVFIPIDSVLLAHLAVKKNLTRGQGSGTESKAGTKFKIF